MSRYEVFPGDVLITVMGTIGRAPLFPDDAERRHYQVRDSCVDQAPTPKVTSTLFAIVDYWPRFHEWLYVDGSRVNNGRPLNMQILATSDSLS